MIGNRSAKGDLSLYLDLKVGIQILVDSFLAAICFLSSDRREDGVSVKTRGSDR